VKTVPLLSLPISLLLCGVAGDANAQGVVCSLSPVMPNYSPLADQAPTPRAAKDLKRLNALLCAKGCGRVGLFQNPTIPNAVIVNAGNGNSRIEYSQAFLDKVQEVFGPDARFGVLAHEFGHHVDANTSQAHWMNPTWDAELRADAWAGCALAKAGMKTQGLKDALRAVGGGQPAPSRVESATGGDQRWVALQHGYEGCGGDGGEMRMAAFDARASSLVTGGCSGNTDCKMGRVCLEGRCERRSSWGGTCLKDIDCPDNQICTGLGRCDNPAGSGQFVAASAVMSQPKVKAPACNAQCGLERRQCRVGAAKTLNECLRGVTTDATYRECSCPSWPSAKPECRQVCERAFEKVDECESDYSPTKEVCLGEAVACRDCK
jgi:hypothetical protein